MPTRRQWMTTEAVKVAALLAATGLLPDTALAAWNAGAFDARSVVDAMKALGRAAPVASGDITLTAPDIAENGASVPVSLSTRLPGVKQMALLVEKNPNILVAVFDLGDGMEPDISTRIKMAESSNVVAVAVMGDGRVLFAQRDVKVTLGGCAA
ncbi:MAG: thiosulfate oxidation carrier protein SoxY [Inhella sp.]|uniref:thiosulfate oxidation carrier protein SoxY n=1 Tax=Inhella sp. TaxID=1921806 RepID=UPI0022BD1CDF|nr:thiosulfate oxidation carrier protein SoxY [Inhella sp.]MCZ8235982.1 thiosulfate oxidation carrier protein SoxY [Inhella sp.]